MQVALLKCFSILSLVGVALNAASANAHVGRLPTRTSHGANGLETIFTRDTSIAALGVAWRDPSGMIWGDVVRNRHNSVRHMDQPHALIYCKRIGAQLPSTEDFARLRGYMGAMTQPLEEAGTGYTPQVLPNLTYTQNAGTWGHYFWTISVRPDATNGSYFIFDGNRGEIYPAGPNIRYEFNQSNVALRCVARQ